MLKRKSSIFLYRRLILQSYYSTLSPVITRNNFTKTHSKEQSIVFYNSQITKFGRIGSIKDAESVFNDMPSKNIVTWTALLTAYVENEQFFNARKVFDEMPQRNIASWNAMITGYVRNVRVNDAYELFVRMPERNAVSCAAMITGFAHVSMFGEAERLYEQMPWSWRDPVCANALICGYLRVGDLDGAIRVFDGMVVRDVVSWSSMVDGYCKKGKVEEARRLFDAMPVKNVVSWTAMIKGYMMNDEFNDGFFLFLSMRREGDVSVNPITLATIVEGCVNGDRFEEGCQIYGLVIHMGFEYDVVLNNSMINMYGKFGCVDAAEKLFHFMARKDAISWNSLLSAYVQADRIDKASELFQIMPRRDIVSWTTMIGGFCAKGDVAKAIGLFSSMPHQDDVAWTTVISGLACNEKFSEAIHWYICMTQRSVRPNVITLSSVISAAAGLANLIHGLQLHAHVVKMDMEFDLSVQNSLVSMYSKCGKISDAYSIFLNITMPNVVSFNSMITGFAYHGLGRESLRLFERMQSEGLQPNEITFLGILSSCSHMGLVDEGQSYFELMRTAYNIAPGRDHFACMIDLLGRAGLLDQAVGMIHSMPFEPNPGVWGALLSASQSHMRPDIAKLAAEELLRLEPDNATPFVVLSNVYSTLGEKGGEEVRETQKLKGIVKSPGCSWVSER